MTDEDKTLLEMAAKAAKLKNYRYRPAEDGLHACIEYDDEDGCTVVWMPLCDDGDALRLAVKLRLDIDHHQFSVNVWDGYIGTGRIPSGDDPYAATRRGIVRAAAEIGKVQQ